MFAEEEIGLRSVGFGNSLNQRKLLRQLVIVEGNCSFTARAKCWGLRRVRDVVILPSPWDLVVIDGSFVEQPLLALHMLGVCVCRSCLQPRVHCRKTILGGYVEHAMRVGFAVVEIPTPMSQFTSCQPTQAQSTSSKCFYRSAGCQGHPRHHTSRYASLMREFVWERIQAIIRLVPLCTSTSAFIVEVSLEGKPLKGDP